MGFKENLKDELSYQGLLAKELTSKAGLPPGSLSNYLRENSSVPSADIAVKIARALNVSVEYLVTGEPKTVTEAVRSYPPEILALADKLSRMSARDRRLVSSLIDAIAQES